MRVVARSLIEGKKVVWTRFGTFEMRQRSERQGINPQTHERITIDATKTPGFTASSAFKERVLGEGTSRATAALGSRDPQVNFADAWGTVYGGSVRLEARSNTE